MLFLLITGRRPVSGRSNISVEDREDVRDSERRPRHAAAWCDVDVTGARASQVRWGGPFSLLRANSHAKAVSRPEEMTWSMVSQRMVYHNNMK